MEDPDLKTPDSTARRDGLGDAGWRLRDQIEKQLEGIRKLCRESARQIEESKAILARMIRLRQTRR
jgi:hypothetical protein